MAARKQILFIALFFTSVACYSQALIKSEDSMVPKQITGLNAVMASYKTSQYGMGGSLAYIKFFQRKISLTLGGSYDIGTLGHADYKRYLANIDVNKTIFDFGDILFFNIGLITGFGNESTSFEFSQDYQESFIYELGFSAGLEIYILPSFSAGIGIRQIVFSDSKMGTRHYYLPFSVRLYY